MQHELHITYDNAGSAHLTGTIPADRVFAVLAAVNAKPGPAVTLPCIPTIARPAVTRARLDAARNIIHTAWLLGAPLCDSPQARSRYAAIAIADTLSIPRETAVALLLGLLGAGEVERYCTDRKAKKFGLRLAAQ